MNRMFKCLSEKCDILNEWICCSTCSEKDNCECKCDYYEFEECSDRKVEAEI